MIEPQILMLVVELPTLPHPTDHQGAGQDLNQSSKVHFVCVSFRQLGGINSSGSEL